MKIHRVVAGKRPAGKSMPQRGWAWILFRKAARIDNKRGDEVGIGTFPIEEPSRFLGMRPREDKRRKRSGMIVLPMKRISKGILPSFSSLREI